MTKLIRKIALATTALCLVATTVLAHAETFAAECPGYTIIFEHGVLTSHAPKKVRTYPTVKIDRQERQTVITGKTPYGKVTATFALGGRDSVAWTNAKDVVVSQCDGVEDEDDSAMLSTA
jgi:hypothetical protein